MKKTIYGMAVVLLTALFVGCGGSQSNSNPNGPITDPEANPSGSIHDLSSVPAAIQSLFSSTCDAEAPIATLPPSNPNCPENWNNGGTRIGDDDGSCDPTTLDLSEKNEGGVISDATQLTARIDSGSIRVEPSSDGQVTWALRKWSVAGTKENADQGLNKIEISATADRIIVTQPPSSQVIINGAMSGALYSTCLVIYAPADWIHTLSSTGSGNITSVGHAGELSVDAASYGNITITKKGAGNVTTNSESGNVTIETDVNGGTLSAITGGYGHVTITQLGPGFVTASAGSGNIDVVADSRGGANLTTAGYGNITYTLRNGGVALQNNSTVTVDSGNITLDLIDAFGLALSAETKSGNITVPASFPAPEVVESGKRLGLTSLNGGGAELALTVQSGYGSIRVTQ